MFGFTFLENFNFETLKDLPEIEDITSVLREEEPADGTPDDQQITLEF